MPSSSFKRLFAVLREPISLRLSRLFRQVSGRIAKLEKNYNPYSCSGDNSKQENDKNWKIHDSILPVQGVDVFSVASVIEHDVLPFYIPNKLKEPFDSFHSLRVNQCKIK
jgi:hypothetical protein